MSAMGIVAKNTFIKIFSKTKYKVFIILTAIINFLIAFVLTSGTVSLGNTPFAFNSSSSAYTTLNILSGFVFPLIIFLLCADFYTQEVSDNSIKAELLRPVKRESIYCGKAIGILYYIIATIGINLALSVIFTAIWGNSSLIPRIILAYFVTILPCVIIILFSGMISVCANQSSLSIFISIIVMVALSAISLLNVNFNVIFFTGYFSWYKLFIGIIPLQNILPAVGVLCSSGVIFYLIGNTLFEKKNI